jgi:hypothetical protein
MFFAKTRGILSFVFDIAFCLIGPKTILDPPDAPVKGCLPGYHSGAGEESLHGRESPNDSVLLRPAHEVSRTELLASDGPARNRRPH